MKKCEGTSAFSEENPRDRRKSLLERRRRHVPNGTMEWNFASTLAFCRGRHWRMMIVEKAARFTAGRKASGSSLFTAEVVSGTRSTASASGSLLH
jgi:hypothetical protein